MTLELDLKFITRKKYPKFQLICEIMKEKIAENYVFPVFYVPKGAQLLQKLTQVDENRT